MSKKKKVRLALIARDGIIISNSKSNQIIQSKGDNNISANEIAYPNVLHTVKPTAINQLILADTTKLAYIGEFRRKRHCYLALIMDDYSRRIVGWSIEIKNSVQLTISALQQVKKLRTSLQGCIHHSQRKDADCNKQYIELCKEYGVTISISDGKGFKNSGKTKSLFGTIKTEWDGLYDPMSIGGLVESFKGFVNYYNCKRPHSSLKYRTPVEHE